MKLYVTSCRDCPCAMAHPGTVYCGLLYQIRTREGHSEPFVALSTKQFHGVEPPPGACPLPALAGCELVPRAAMYGDLLDPDGSGPRYTNPPTDPFIARMKQRRGER